ncbi:MAG: maleylpyruvate isomerase family mycothiol-dependent enzyme [Candidatus Dormibacteria bacterium]
MSEGLLSTADGFRAGYRDTLLDIERVSREVGDDQWDVPTGCPGWAVRDLFAHVADLESILSGRPRGDHTIDAEPPHVRNPAGHFMEIGVDMRRARPIDDVLAELRELIPLRLATLDAITDADLDGDVPGFLGTSKLRNQLTIRIFDLWSHDQDARRALHRPGDCDGPAAAHSRELMLRGAARRIHDLHAPAAGTSVLVEITGPGAARRGLVFDGDRGRAVTEAPERPDVSLRMDLSTLTVLACGRADDPDARDRVDISGDRELGARMLTDIASTP